MNSIFSSRLRSSLNYLWLAAAAVYLSVSAGRAMLNNYHSQQQIETLEQRAVTLKLEQQRLEALLVYLSTDAYKEKELRRALLLIRPGERVYALPESANPQILQDVAVNLPVKSQSAKDIDSTPWRAWIDYLF